MSTAKGLRPQVLRVPGKSYQAAQSRPLAFLQESLESALMGTHQEMEMFGSQPAYPEKLLHKKESLQNQLINIRVELSQATTVMRGVGGRGSAVGLRLVHTQTGEPPLFLVLRGQEQGAVPEGHKQRPCLAKRWQVRKPAHPIEFLPGRLARSHEGFVQDV